MVDIVGRVIVEEDDSRWIKFKTDTIQFGGGRLKFDTDKVELDYNKFMNLYKTAKPEANEKIIQQEQAQEEEKKPSIAANIEEIEPTNVLADKPKRRSRKSI